MCPTIAGQVLSTDPADFCIANDVKDDNNDDDQRNLSSLPFYPLMLVLSQTFQELYDM
jgi:hypothetical protein